MHNLTTQPFHQEQVVVAKQEKPSSFKVQEVPFKFIYHNETHFFGFNETWIDDYDKVNCSDLEKTIIDCLFKPPYAGGIVEIFKAIGLSKDKLNYSKLLSYAIRFRSQAVIKRLGFLLELSGLKHSILQDLYYLKKKSITPLDPGLPKAGFYYTKWSILVNVDTNTLKSTIET